MSVVASLLLLAAAAKVPAAGLMPMSCRVATRSGDLLEFRIKPITSENRVRFAFEGIAAGPDQLANSEAVFLEQDSNEWEFKLIRKKVEVGRVRIVRNGPLRNITFLGSAPNTRIANAFGFCSDHPVPPTENQPARVNDFIDANAWTEGCAFVSPNRPGLIAFNRKTIMGANGMVIVLTTPDGSNYNQTEGSPLVAAGGGKDRANFLAVERFDDGQGRGARGIVVTYADPDRNLGSQLIKLNRHALAYGSMYGICSLSVAAVPSGVSIKD